MKYVLEYETDNIMYYNDYYLCVNGECGAHRGGYVVVGGEEEGLGEVAQPGQLPRVPWSHRQVVTNAAVVPKLMVSVALKQVNMCNLIIQVSCSSLFVFYSC